jgi:hypothetical protein
MGYFKIVYSRTCNYGMLNVSLHSGHLSSDGKNSQGTLAMELIFNPEAVLL